MEIEFKDSQWAANREGDFPRGPYGLMHTEGDMWIGDDDGPRMYTDWSMARVAEQVVGVQLGYRPGRIRAMTFACPNPRKKEDLTTRMSAVEALWGLEENRFL